MIRKLIRRRRNEEKRLGWLRNLVSRGSESRKEQQTTLAVEALEDRVLLTTIVHPAGAVFDTTFVYADPEETEPAQDVTIFNVLRIGTLSGQPSQSDVVLELLDYKGGDISGNYTPGGVVDGVFGTTPLFGGPGGGAIIEEVLPDQVGRLGFAVDALATNSRGDTYGITRGGVLVRVNTTTGLPDAVLGIVTDTAADHIFASADITYTEFQSAHFVTDASGKEWLYAVAWGPTSFTGLGLPATQGEVLIKIDLTDVANGRVEAEPVGRDGLGRASYERSQILIPTLDDDGNVLRTDITTIALYEPAFAGQGLATDQPVFISYNATSTALVTINVNVNGVTGETVVSWGVVNDIEADDVVVAGLMYDDRGRLFGLTHTVNDQNEMADGMLVLVNLNGGTDDTTLIEAVEYGQYGDPAQDIFLSGMTFDPLSQMGYATDPQTGTLYTLNVSRMELTPEGDWIINGLADIYTMYILQADADTYITITRFDTGSGQYTPTVGEGASTLEGGEAVALTPDNAGGVMIGTVPVPVGDGNPPPIFWMPRTIVNPLEVGPNSGGASPLPAATTFAPKGVWPGGQFRPGIIVAPDHHVGKIQIDGGVFGDVDVRGGSIGAFYAGYLGTNNFNVNGDIQSIVVATDAAHGSGTVTNSMSVQGAVNNIYCAGNWEMPLKVFGNSNVDAFPGLYDARSGFYVDTIREIERKVDSTGYDDTPSYFTQGALDRGDGSFIIVNDSPLTAQFLGTVNNRLQVVGQNEALAGDVEDYYSFALMAGETIEVFLYRTLGVTNPYTGHPFDPSSLMPFPGGLGLFDPALKLMATNIERNLAASEETGALIPYTITLTAQEAGIYTVGVAAGGTYRLEITGTQEETVLGGMNVLGTIANATATTPRGILVDGNVGALSAGGNWEAVSVTVAGHLGAVRAGYAAGTAIGFGSDGIVGSIAATGNLGSLYSPARSLVNLTVGGDLQSLHIGYFFEIDTEGASNGDTNGYFVGLVAVDGNIGEVRLSGSLTSVFELPDGTLGVYNSGIFANADGRGAGGIIDVISIGGAISGSIISTGPRGGNVRFVEVAGSIPRYGEVVFAAGQVARVVDDSGAIIRITPGFKGDDGTGSLKDNFVPIDLKPQDTTAGDDDDDDDTGDTGDTGDADDAGEVIPPGQITLKLLPVYDMSFAQWASGARRTAVGFAIASIDCSDGVSIAVEKSNRVTPVEIGVIYVAGTVSTAEDVAHEDRTCVIGGSNPISVFKTVVTGSIDRLTNQTGGDMISIVLTEETGYIPPDVDNDGIPDNIDDDITDGTGDADEDINVELLIPFNSIRVKGHIGWAASTTGQRIYSSVLSTHADGGYTNDQLVDPSGSLLGTTIAVSDLWNPIGVQRSGIYSQVGIITIETGGALGHVTVAGDVNSIKINSDKSNNTPERFEGVTGCVVVWGDLNRIEMGDGIGVVGTGVFAETGVYVQGTLARASVEGYGHDLKGPVMAQTEITRLTLAGGSSLIGNGLNRNVAVANSFGGFHANWAITMPGSIGTLEVTGASSRIHGALITANAIDKLFVAGGAEGIFYSTIRAGGSVDDDLITTGANNLGQLTVGGQGLINSYVYGQASIDKVKILPGAMIEESILESRFDIHSIEADRMLDSWIIAPRLLDKVTLKDGASNLTVNASELRALAVKNDLLGSAIMVAGPLNSLKVGGNLVSTIELTGPYSTLKSMTIGGDFGTPAGGQLLVDGQIGSIKVGGDFRAKMELNWDSARAEPRYESILGVELKSLTVGGRLMVDGNAGGSIGSIKAAGDFGRTGDALRVWGDLKSFTVGSGRAEANLNSDLVVEGDLGSVKVYGDLNGDIVVKDDFKSLELLGKKGAVRADMNGDVIVGGDFDQLTIKNGDQFGSYSASGSGPKLSISGSDIVGVAIVSGGAGIDPIDGSITATGRYVSSGDIDVLHIKGGIEEGGMVYIDGNLGRLIVEGDLSGLVHVTGTIGQIVAGSMGLTAGGAAGTVTAGGDIGSVEVAGTMKDSFVVAGFNPGIGSSFAGILAGTIDPFNMTGAESDALWLAAAGELRIDGTAADPGESPGVGSIKTVTVKRLENSVVAAGVGPGRNAVFGDADGSDLAGPGVSSIGAVRIDEQAGTGAPFGVFADTGIGKMTLEGSKTSTPYIDSGSGFRAWTVSTIGQGDLNGVYFDAQAPLNGKTLDGKPFVVKLSGPGVGRVKLTGSDIAAIQLTGTTGKSRLTVEARGADTVNVGYLFTGDDEGLRSLSIDGQLGVAGQTTEIGGPVGTIQLGKGVAAGARIIVAGGVKTADLGEIASTAALATLIHIEEGIGTLKTAGIGANATLMAQSIASATLQGDLDGRLSATGAAGLGTVKVGGDLAGSLNSNGAIRAVGVTGAIEGVVRAAGDINTVTAGSIHAGEVAAGGNLKKVTVKGDVSYSTLAAGLDLGVAGSLDGATPQAGNLGSVRIKGDLLQSNLAAGVAPGADLWFGTGDDLLAVRQSERIDAPRVESIRMLAANGGNQFDTIQITFVRQLEEKVANIGTVRVDGFAYGSTDSDEQYAIIASGEVKQVTVHGQSFSQSGNVQSMSAGGKKLNGSAVASAPLLTLADALAASVRVQKDGLNYEFADLAAIQAGTADDEMVFSPEGKVWIEYDDATNTILYRKTDGFAISPEGTNYYRITLDAGQVANRMGVKLDGEFAGEFPSGNGTPGGDFVYHVAIGDVGDSTVAAFNPFMGDFPINVTWEHAETLGNSNFYNGVFGANFLYDDDFYRLNGLEKGQIVKWRIEDYNLRNSLGLSYLDMAPDIAGVLYRVEDAQFIQDNWVYVMEANGRADLNPARAALAPSLDQVAYGGNAFYGYESMGGSFFRIDKVLAGTTANPDDIEFTLLANTLNDLNQLASVQAVGRMTGLKALAGHAGDALWAIGEFGTAGQRLILIRNLEADLDDPAAALRTEVTVAGSALPAAQGDIVGLAELNGTLYGVDATSLTLVTLGSNPSTAGFGVAAAVGALDQAGTVLADLRVTGLSAHPNGVDLMVLHDQPANVVANRLTDALYQVDPDTGAAALAPWYEFAVDEARGGIAAEPNGAILVATPLNGSPVGDALTVTYENETQEHLFGGTADTVFGESAYPLLTVTTDPSIQFENLGGADFINGGFYYAIKVSYNTNLKEDLIVTIGDLNWLADTNLGQIVSVVTDDPVNVVAQTNFADQIALQINPQDGDGDVIVYFASTAGIQRLVMSDLDRTGQIIGADGRQDLNPPRTMILPGLTELTVSPLTLDVIGRVDPDDFSQTLSTTLRDAELLDDLEGFLTPEVLALVEAALPPSLQNEFYSHVKYSEFDAVGYDSAQRLFALVDTLTFDTLPIMVADPRLDVPVMLTLEVLSDIYAAQENLLDSLDRQVVITGIRGLDFGLEEFDQNGQLVVGSLPALYAIVTVVETDLVSGAILERDSLIEVGSIVNPAGTIAISERDFRAEGFSGITELAFCDVPYRFAANGSMYGYDAASKTLLRIDHREMIRNNPSNTWRPNPDFGRAVAVGGVTGNLGGNGGQDPVLSAMDFNASGMLVAIDETTNTLVAVEITENYPGELNRIRLLQQLPGDSYEALTFDSRLAYGRGFLIQTTGSDRPSTMSVKVTAAGQVTEGTYVFGTDTDYTIADGNADVDILTLTSDLLAGTVAQGGYHAITIDYSGMVLPAGSEVIRLQLSAVEWLAGMGEIDAVAVSDELAATVISFGDDSIIVEVDTYKVGDNETVTLYLGSTSNVYTPYGTHQVVGLVGYGVSAELFVPEDGDYLLRVTGLSNWLTGMVGTANAVKYDLSMRVFDDGNGDFGGPGAATSQIVLSDGYIYEKLIPGNRPVDLSSGSADLIADPYRSYIYRTANVKNPVEVTANQGRFGIANPLNPTDIWTVTVPQRSLLTAGEAGSVTVSSTIGCLQDSDIYSFTMKEGQTVTVDIDAETLFGGTEVDVWIGLFNADFESMAVIGGSLGEYVLDVQSQTRDPQVTVQAIETMPGHAGVTIDPMTNGIGQYYLVVTGLKTKDDQNGWDSPIAYEATITLSEPRAVVEPPSQLVYLAFGDIRTGKNEIAEYLAEALNGYPDIMNRPAFDASKFGDDTVTINNGVDRDYIISAVAARIEQFYREAGLTEDEIEFTTIRPGSAGSPYPADATYSTLIVGGRATEPGLGGIAETIDLYNANRTDKCVLFTDEVASIFKSNATFSDDKQVRLEQIVQVLSYIGAHEMTHTMGLEHSTEVDPDITDAGTYESNNMMNYYFNFKSPKFETRNSYWDFAAVNYGGIQPFTQLGFSNEIDLLLRNIGSGTAMGR